MKTELDTRVESHSEFRLTFEKKVRLLTLSSDKALTSFQILSMTQALSMDGHASNVARNERHYPFNFNVQSWLRHDHENSLLHKRLASRNNFASLPPSLKHEVLPTPQGTRRPRAGAHVTYKLTAHLLKDRKVIDQIMQPILLLISQDPSPPMCMADFVGEYQMAQKCLLRTPLFQKAGELTIFAQEPKQLTVRPNCAESMVELPIRLVWKRQKQEINVYQSTRIEAEVKWQFRMSTFVSLMEQRGPATLKQALVSPATAYVRSTLPPKTLSMAWRKWKPVGSSKTKIQCEQSLWLSLPRSEILTPTFWSPFLSRRYSVWLQVKIHRPGSAKLEVEVPIQVGIESTASAGLAENARADGEGLFEDTDGDELLPQYSRLG